MFDLYWGETVADCHARVTDIHVQLTLQSLLDTQILAKEAATTPCRTVIYTVNNRITVYIETKCITSFFGWVYPQSKKH